MVWLDLRTFNSCKTGALARCSQRQWGPNLFFSTLSENAQKTNNKPQQQTVLCKSLEPTTMFFYYILLPRGQTFFLKAFWRSPKFLFQPSTEHFSPVPDCFLRNIYFFKIQTYVAADRQLSKEIKLYLLRLFKVTICQKTEFKNQWQQVLWSDEGKCFWFRSLCTEEVQHWV